MRDKKGTHRFWGVLFYLALMVTIVSASYAGVRFCSNLVTEQTAGCGGSVRSGDKKRAAGKRKK